MSRRLNTPGRIITAIALCSCFVVKAQDSGPEKIPTFSASVETVRVRLTVTDAKGRRVTGLTEENFSVYEDNVKQAISYFSSENGPISLAILQDVSASMGPSDQQVLQMAKQTLQDFLNAAGDPDDEYFLIVFNERTAITQLLSKSSPEQKEVSLQIPRGTGWTAIYDALYLGLNKIKDARHDRRGILLFTDGGENHSRYTEQDVIDIARESEAPIYVMGNRENNRTLNAIANTSGGRSLPSPTNTYKSLTEAVQEELRRQYQIWYTPSNTEHNGKWRRITVKMNLPRGSPRVIIHARDGYYAPKL